MVILILTAYCLLLVLFNIGWHFATQRPSHTDVEFNPRVSVVIAARNEESNIAAVLASLRNQNYSHFEVLVVDDQSTDNTVSVIRDNFFPKLSVIKSQGIGKKAALETGINNATGEIIVTTDADCVFGPRWLSTIVRSFVDPSVKFAFGAVSIHTNENFFTKLQALEFSTLIGSAAATSSWNKPIMCNGANLAFRKDVFFEVKGYSDNRHIASGDDEFLMRKILMRYPRGVQFINDPNSVVGTQPQPTLSAFINQRLRWAAKWRFNTSILTVCIALFIFGTQLAVLLAYANLPLGDSSTAILLLVKIALEALLIYRVCRFTAVKFSLSGFLILQVIYPVYVIFVAILSNFKGAVWKERNVKP